MPLPDVAHVLVVCGERSAGDARQRVVHGAAPVPKLTLPVPETVTPPLRLIEPPVAAEIVPWQFTRSAMEPLPEKPCPGNIVKGRADVVHQDPGYCNCRKRSPD